MQRFTSFDGTRIAYLSRGEGPAVLLLHGHGGSVLVNWVFTGVVEALAKAGRRAVALDHRGHGDSDKPHAPEAYEDEAMRRDAQALLDHLGLAAVDVVGYSMGSLITVQLALAESRVRSILLGGAGMPGGSGRDTRMTADDERAVFLAEDPATITQPDARRLRDFLDLMNADRQALYAASQARPGDVPRIDTISVPTLILTGDADDVVGSPELLGQLIPGARVTLIRGDHLTALADPAFVAGIVGWLGEVSPLAA